MLGACVRPAAVPPPPASSPPFMRLNYEPFTRNAAVAVALREWRLWGSPVHDEPPDSRPPPAPEDKPERQEGMWQRVGEYWWLGTDATRAEARWTGRHDANGTVFGAERDAEHAWSAAFIGYVLFSAGAGTRFTGSAAHSTYINGAVFATSGDALRAHRIDQYAPAPGDLICYSRGARGPVSIASLTGGGFTSHCDMVVNRQSGSLGVVGGNVGDAVAMKHVPITAEGMLGHADGSPLDPRYQWFVVLEVLYDR